MLDAWGPFVVQAANPVNDLRAALATLLAADLEGTTQAIPDLPPSEQGHPAATVPPYSRRRPQYPPLWIWLYSHVTPATAPAHAATAAGGCWSVRPERASAVQAVILRHKEG